jgi:D-tyrosyl-tRNA(Tyr) deacylase
MIRMKAVFQRVSRARRSAARGAPPGRIGPGAVILLGMGRADTEAEAAKLADKVAKLRVFDDAEGKMNLPITSVPGAKFVVVSQFTLHGDAERGTARATSRRRRRSRPSRCTNGSSRACGSWDSGSRRGCSAR